jgi:hypothetical protein
VEICVVGELNFAAAYGWYAILSDPITSHIAVIKDRIANGEYSSQDEKTSWGNTIADLLAQRNDIRLQIAEYFPYKERN